jgi:hypothetical protein
MKRPDALTIVFIGACMILAIEFIAMFLGGLYMANVDYSMECTNCD